MAADKRAARLGVLALVATLLFGAVGARLWFLQTVQAESLQQTVDARKTKTVRLVPERGRIFDADGRILADNERVLTVSRRLGRDPRRHRPGRAVHPPVRVAGDAGRRDGGALRLRALQPLPADAAQGGRRGAGGHRPRGAGRGLPRRDDRRRTGGGSYPYAPLASHVLGYMGAITAEDAGSTTRSSATTRRSAARTSGAAASS